MPGVQGDWPLLRGLAVVLQEGLQDGRERGGLKEKAE